MSPLLDIASYVDQTSITHALYYCNMRRRHLDGGSERWRQQHYSTILAPTSAGCKSKVSDKCLPPTVDKMSSSSPPPSPLAAVVHCQIDHGVGEFEACFNSGISQRLVTSIFSLE